MPLSWSWKLCMLVEFIVVATAARRCAVLGRVCYVRESTSRVP